MAEILGQRAAPIGQAVPVAELETQFDRSVYDLPIPGTDGFKADTITIRFVGVVNLDRTDRDHLDFVDAMRLGSPVRLIVTGAVSGKGFTHQQGRDEDKIGYYAALRIADVEIGEPA